jgi:hypothetical protein
MNTMLIQSPMSSLLVQSSAGLHRVYSRCRLRDRDRTRGVARTSFTDGQDVIGRCPDDTSNTDFAIRVRPAWLKSP